MDKIWHRSVVRYLHIKELAPKGIHAHCVAISGDDDPALSTAKKWAAAFKRDR